MKKIRFPRNILATKIPAQKNLDWLEVTRFRLWLRRLNARASHAHSHGVLDVFQAGESATPCGCARFATNQLLADLIEQGP